MSLCGVAYGARSAEPGGFEGGQPTLDIQLPDGSRVLVASEEPYASEIAGAIGEAWEWAELPMVWFEPYQVVGVGR